MTRPSLNFRVKANLHRLTSTQTLFRYNSSLDNQTTHALVLSLRHRCVLVFTFQSADGSNPKKYIACQGKTVLHDDVMTSLPFFIRLFLSGPLVRETSEGVVNTVPHFWQMVWQYNVDVVVMLTTLVEINSVCSILAPFKT